LLRQVAQASRLRPLLLMLAQSAVIRSVALADGQSRFALKRPFRSPLRDSISLRAANPALKRWA